MQFPKRTERKRAKKTPDERTATQRLADLFEGIRQGPCQACGRIGRCDVEHLKTRGSGGEDILENLWSACRKCHIEKGAKGISHMVERYPRLRQTLIAKGWAFDEYRGKWTR